MNRHITFGEAITRLQRSNIAELEKIAVDAYHDVNERCGAIFLLWNSRHTDILMQPGVVNLMRDLLDDLDHDKHSLAVSVLAEAGEDALVGHVDLLLSRANRRKKIILIGALGRLGTKSALSVLHDIFQTNSDFGLRILASTFLLASGMQLDLATVEQYLWLVDLHQDDAIAIAVASVAFFAYTRTGKYGRAFLRHLILTSDDWNPALRFLSVQLHSLIGLDLRKPYDKWRGPALCWVENVKN